VIAAGITFFYFVKMSIYDIKFADTLPSKGIKDIPPSDNILPNIFAQIPLTSPPQITKSTLNNTNNLPPLNNEISPLQCFDYAKNCRDVQCAFKDFNFICNDNKGPVCTCGSSQVSGASSILSNTLLPIFISLIISVYYYI